MREASGRGVWAWARRRKAEAATSSTWGCKTACATDFRVNLIVQLRTHVVGFAALGGVLPCRQDGAHGMETVVTTFSGLMGSCAADFFSGTPTHAAEPSSARIAKLRQEINSRTPLMPTVNPPLADLHHPDAEHLLLGINLEGLREACELVGFRYMCYKDGMKYDAWAPYKYKRKDHPEMAWLDKAYHVQRGARAAGASCVWQKVVLIQDSAGRVRGGRPSPVDAG